MTLPEIPALSSGFARLYRATAPRIQPPSSDQVLTIVQLANITDEVELSSRIEEVGDGAELDVILGWLRLFQSDRKSFRAIKYELIRPLSVGGQAVVYEAKQSIGESDSRTVAVKVLREAERRDEGARRRFHNEVQLTKKLASIDGIIPILDSGAIVLESDGVAVSVPYFAMRLVESELGSDRLVTYGQMLSSNHDAGLGLMAVVRACATLHQMHLCDVAHADLSRRNLLIAGEMTWLIDFGTALTFGSLPDDAHRTPGYYDPTERNVGRHNDIRAIGVLLSEAVLGRVDALEAREAWNEAKVRLKELDGSLRVICHRCIHDEYDSLDDVAREVEWYLAREHPFLRIKQMLITFGIWQLGVYGISAWLLDQAVARAIPLQWDTSLAATALITAVMIMGMYGPLLHLIASMNVDLPGLRQIFTKAYWKALSRSYLMLPREIFATFGAHGFPPMTYLEKTRSATLATWTSQCLVGLVVNLAFIGAEFAEPGPLTTVGLAHALRGTYFAHMVLCAMGFLTMSLSLSRGVFAVMAAYWIAGAVLLQVDPLRIKHDPHSFPWELCLFGVLVLLNAVTLRWRLRPVKPRT